MGRALLFISLISVALSGCVSTEEMQRNAAADQQAHAACRANSKSHLAFAKCENAIVLARAEAANKDLLVLAAATRENIADKLDRKIITEQEAQLEEANAASQITTTYQQRMLVASQTAAVDEIMESASRPPVVIQRPQMVHCTSNLFMTTVTTNCY